MVHELLLVGRTSTLVLAGFCFGLLGPCSVLLVSCRGSFQESDMYGRSTSAISARFSKRRTVLNGEINQSDFF